MMELEQRPVDEVRAAQPVASKWVICVTVFSWASLGYRWCFPGMMFSRCWKFEFEFKQLAVFPELASLTASRLCSILKLHNQSGEMLTGCLLNSQRRIISLARNLVPDDDDHTTDQVFAFESHSVPLWSSFTWTNAKLPVIKVYCAQTRLVSLSSGRCSLLFDRSGDIVFISWFLGGAKSGRKELSPYAIKQHSTNHFPVAWPWQMDIFIIIK